MAMNVFLWIVIGLLTGSTARKLLPGPAAGGMPVAITIGVTGAVLGGVMATICPSNSGENFDTYSLLMATAGALYPLFIYRCIAMRSHRPLHQGSTTTYHTK